MTRYEAIQYLLKKALGDVEYFSARTKDKSWSGQPLSAGAVKMFRERLTEARQLRDEMMAYLAEYAAPQRSGDTPQERAE